MRHARGEPADGLEFLRLDELGLRGLDLLVGAHQLAIGVDGGLVGREEEIENLPAAGGDDVFLAIEGNGDAGIRRSRRPRACWSRMDSMRERRKFSS